MKKSDHFFAAAAKYTSIAITLPGAVFGGYFLGYALDKWFGTTWLKIVCLLLGIAGAFIQIIRQVIHDSPPDSK